MICLIISCTNFVYLLVDPGLLSPPLNFYEASRFVPQYDGRPRQTQWTKRQTNELTDGWTVRLLDGVQHFGQSLVLAFRVQTVLATLVTFVKHVEEWFVMVNCRLLSSYNLS